MLALDVARLAPPWLRERTGSVAPASATLGITYPAVLYVQRVQIALGADLSADPSTWSWLDITSRVRQNGIAVSTGRRDESSAVTTGSAQITLDNRDGALSRRNPNSPYYGLLSKNTPIWATIDAGSGEKTRLEMFVNEWPTRWADTISTDSTVTVQCAGIMRRLAQGEVLKSALRRVDLNANPFAYWPMEDGGTATAVSSGLPNGQPMTGASPTFTTGPPGSTGALDLLAGASPDYIIGRVTLASTTAFQVEFAAVSDSADITVVLQIQALASNLNINLGLSALLSDGTPHHIAAQIVQNGSNVDVTLYRDGVFSSTTPFTSDTITSTVNLKVPVGQPLAPPASLVTISHLVVFSSLSDPSPRAGAVTGYSGEQAHVRIGRLCAEERVLFATSAANTATMGPQGPDTLLNLVTECASADLGVLYEKHWGLAYKSRHEFYNQAAGLALDFNSGHIADLPEPADDDQRTRNKWTVSRTDGSEATAEKTSGPMGTGSAGPGVYHDSATLNLETDAQLPDYANWLVRVGTVDEDRWPSIGLNFLAKPELIDAWTALGYGARITVAHPPTQMPPDDLDLIVEGHTEWWDGIEWRASLNCSPASVYRVAIVDDPAPDQNVPRVGSGTAVLAASYSSSDLSFSVTTGAGGLWTTDAADFPLDINISGERIRLSAISGAASPQTFTVSARSVNGIQKSLNAGARVEVWQTAVVGL